MASHKNIALTALKFAVPAAIIGGLLWTITPQQWADLRQQTIHWPILFSALMVAFVSIVLSFVRWWMLVRCLGIRLSVVEALRLSAICFLLSFVSVGSVGGDLFKAVFLARRSGQPIAAVSSIIVDRGVGMYGLLLLVAGGLLARSSSDSFEFNGLSLENLKWTTASLIGIGTAVLMVLVFGGRMIDHLIHQCGRLPVVGGLILKVGPPLRMFHDHPWAFLVSIVMSVMVHGMLTISFYLIATSMYRSTPTFAEHFLIVPIGLLAAALPLTPGGVGVFEATIESLYRIVPATKTAASGTIIGLAFELVKVAIALLGTIFYWTASSEEQASLSYTESHADASLDNLAEVELPAEGELPRKSADTK